MFQKIKHTLELIKFSHSLFALPFALSSLLFATNGHPSLRLVILVILAMLFARNAAMAFNRLADADIDAQNPRTLSRHIPQQLLSPKYVAFFICVNSILFIFISSLFNRLSLILSPIALLIIFGYSLTKRFTHLTQIFLGFSLGISPVAAWIAATGKIEISPLFIGLGVLFWVAGFDILYATQDYQFDKKAGLKSLVVAFGIPKALRIAKIFHAASVLSLFGFGFCFGTNWIYPHTNFGVWIYQVTVGLIGFLLILEHRLIKASDLSRINAAFFTMNGMIGIVYLAGNWLSLTIQR